jgi:hypothetical protein
MDCCNRCPNTGTIDSDDHDHDQLAYLEKTGEYLCPDCFFVATMAQDGDKETGVKVLPISAAAGMTC